jgi:photosystem II stability/assembly factor-like uncharacterized protein
MDVRDSAGSSECRVCLDVAPGTKPWTIISGGKEGGFYKSTDGGETFREDHDRPAY